MQAVRDRSFPETHVKQIIQALYALPPEKVTEVWDFVAFLQDRYAEVEPVDTDDSWNDQDLHDLRQASLAYAESALWVEEKHDAQTG